MNKVNQLLFLKLTLMMSLLSYYKVEAGVLGDFSHIENLPGYIDLSENSYFYQGPLSRGEGRDHELFRNTPSQILKRFIVNGNVSREKLLELEEEINNYMDNARIAYCQRKFAEELRDNAECIADKIPDENLHQKWKKNKAYLALNFAIKSIEKARELGTGISAENINQRRHSEFLSLFFQGIEAYDGVTSGDPEMGGLSELLRTIRKGMQFVRNRAAVESDRVDASNLVKNISAESDQELFYSYDELEDLKSNGVDISQLDPPSSGFWRKPEDSISSYDTTNYNNTAAENLEKLLDPDEVNDLLDRNKAIKLVYNLEIPDGGQSPKINVEYKGREFKLKFLTDRHGFPESNSPDDELQRIMQGSEVDTEVVVNNLAAALGFTVDPTFHKAKVKIYLEDEVYEQDLFDVKLVETIQALTERFADNMNMRSAFQNIKVDEEGRKYIEMKYVQLEQKAHRKTDVNIGCFQRHGFAKSLAREHRAFAIFLAWIADPDVKAMNDKLKIIPFENEEGDKDYKIAYSVSDMGSGLALNYPNNFNFNLIKRVERDRSGKLKKIKFRHPRIFPLRIMDAANINDAKWMARLISQLTEDQIYRAFENAGYPEVVGRYFTLLLLRKRNSLLEALDMIGESFIDHGGRQFTIRKVNQFEGTIEGFEEFFRNGRLVDPENRLFRPEIEPFPRHWGVGYQLRDDEGLVDVLTALRSMSISLITGTVYNRFISEMDMTTSGRLNFRRFNIFGEESNDDVCAQDCFLQALDIGVGGFIPFRFIINNPNQDSENPYLVVDIFRTQVYMGYNGSTFASQVGVEIPNAMELALGGRVYRVNEYIKIRPISSRRGVFDELEELATTPLLSFSRFRQEFVERMQEGEILVRSSYFGQQLGVRVGTSPLGRFGPTLGLVSQHLTAKRITVLRAEGDQSLVNWNSLNVTRHSLELDAFRFLFRLPLLRMGLERLSDRDRSYQFDLSNEEQNAIYINSIDSYSPEGVPDYLRRRDRNINESSGFINATLFGFIGRRRYRRRIEVRSRDFVDNTESHTLSFERGIDDSRMRHLEFATMESLYRVSLDSNGKFYAKFDYHAENPMMRRNEFLRVFERLAPILPDNFIAWDPEAVREYLGEFSLESKAIISDEGLQELFDKNKSEALMCISYLEQREVSNPEQACLSSSRSPESRSAYRRFKKVYKRYERARGLYWEVRESGEFSNSRLTRRALRKIVNMLFDKQNFKWESMRFFLSHVSEINKHRFVSMQSSMEAFPGFISEVRENVGARGSFTPTDRMLADQERGYFEMFSDKIHESIHRFFLNWSRED